MLGRTHWICMAAGAALVLVAQTAPLVGSAVAGGAAALDTVRTRRLEIVNDDGVVVARVGSDETGGIVELFGPDGEQVGDVPPAYRFFAPRRLNESTPGVPVPLSPDNVFPPGETDTRRWPPQLDESHELEFTRPERPAPRRGSTDTSIWFLRASPTRR